MYSLFIINIYVYIFINVNIYFKNRCQNIVIEVMMNIHYDFVIIECKSYCKN